MCFSYNIIEFQAYEMSEKIRLNSIYKFVRVEYLEGNNVKKGSGSALITKVILEDKDGTLYSVEPNPNGLGFAKGEITYKEYNKLQNRETINVLGISSVIIIFFSVLMFVLMRYLI